jgi:hypothetical protein
MSVRNPTGFELSNLLRLRQPRSTASQNDLGNTPQGWWCLLEKVRTYFDENPAV